MKKIHDTLFILHKCDLNIRLVWEAIDTHREKGPLFSKHHFTQNLTHFIILESMSFLEEYRKHFVHKEIEEDYADRVSMVREICKPIFKQINKWKDLGRFRDNFIAHPWRNGKKLVVPLNSEYDIPRTWLEFQFLKDLVHYLHEVIKCEFEAEMEYALFFSDELSEDVKPKFDIDCINKEVILIHQELNRLTSLHRRNYDIKIFTY